MLNNIEHLAERLRECNLTKDEACLYVALLRQPNTHLRLSHITGINRTKVYRLIEQLEQRSLVARRSDDRGTFLVAKDPSALEIGLIAQEQELKKQRAVLESLMPVLEVLKSQESNAFVVHTYEGIGGMKQMQWHELRTQDELLVLGNVTVEDLTLNRSWSEKHRALSVEAGYKIREIINEPYANSHFTENDDFLQRTYKARTVSKEALPVNTPIVIYNNTVAIYTYRQEKRMGLEIMSDAFAATMRHIFEHYWQLSDPHTAGKD